MEDNWIKIHERSGPDKYWLLDVLKDEGIPFKSVVETVGDWSEIFRFTFVPPEYEERVIRIIDDYHDSENYVEHDLQEGWSRLEKKICPKCGRAFDVEYKKCPFCKKSVG